MTAARKYLLSLIFASILLPFGSNFPRSSAPAADERLLYIPQPGTPVWSANFVEPDLACNYAGIGGQAFDQYGQSNPGLIVRAVGSLSEKAIDILAVTGSNEKLGPAGYSIQLADRPILTSGSIVLKLQNIEGEQLSVNVRVDTSDACEKNLVIVNFYELNITNSLFFPIVKR